MGCKGGSEQPCLFGLQPPPHCQPLENVPSYLSAYHTGTLSAHFHGPGLPSDPPLFLHLLPGSQLPCSSVKVRRERKHEGKDESAWVSIWVVCFLFTSGIGTHSPFPQMCSLLTSHLWRLPQRHLLWALTQ